MRLVGRILLFVLGVGMIAALVYLVPPHVQVRRVSGPLPSLDSLQALQASDAPVQLEYFIVATQESALGIAGHSIFLLEWPDGRRFMIDAGMDEATSEEFGKTVERLFDAEPQKFRADVAEVLGDGIRSVSGVGFTHLHIDHTQGVVPFCRARGAGATVFQTTWQATLHNLNTTDGARLVESSCLERSDLGTDMGILEVPGFPGLWMLALGGHTPGSTLFVTRVDGRLWLFAGDTTNSKADLLSDTGKGFVYSYLLVFENEPRLGNLRRWLAELDSAADVSVVVSHDLRDIESLGIRRFGSAATPAL